MGTWSIVGITVAVCVVLFAILILKLARNIIVRFIRLVLSIFNF